MPPAQPTPGRQRGAALLLGALLLSVLLADVVARGRVYFERDIHLQWQPQALSLARALAAGQPPFWQADAGFGLPLLANPNNQLFYPSTWLLLPLPPELAYVAFVALHLALAGLGAARLARAQGLGRPGAATAGLLWMASGVLLSLVSLWNHLAAAAWLPWCAWAGERLRGGEGAGRRLVVAGFVLSAPILAGSPEMTLMGWALFAAMLVVGPAQAAGRARAWARLAVVAFLALLVSAPQLLPTVMWLQGTRRALAGASEWGFWSQHPLGLLQWLLPLPLADLPLSADLREALFESREPYLRSLYAGLLALPLALVGASRHARRGLWFVAGAVGLLLALGSHLPVAAALAGLPPFSMLRFPVKFLALPALAWSILAGAGLDSWPAASPRGRAAALTATAVLALGLAGLAGALALDPQAWGAWLLATPDPALLRGCVWGLGGAAVLALAGIALAAGRRRAGVLGLAALAVADLGLQHARLHPSAPLDLFQFRPALLSALRGTTLPRLYVFDYADVAGSSERRLGRARAFRVRVPDLSRDSRWYEALALRAYLYPPIGAAFGLPGSFEMDRLRLQPRALAALDERLAAAEGTPDFGRLLRLGGVTHVVALHHDIPGTVPVATLPSLFAEPIQLATLEGALPFAWVVGQARSLPDEQALDLLGTAGFDPAREALLPSGPGMSAAPGFAGEAVLRARAAGHLELDARASGPGLLVLPVTHDRGWRARVDGQAAPVLRANLAFCGVALPAGTHRVELDYGPPGLGAGLALGACGLLLAAGLWRGSRREPFPAPGASAASVTS